MRSGHVAEERPTALIGACALACKAAGIELDSRLDHDRQLDSVVEVASAAGLRTRRVALGQGWWRRGFEPFVGFAGEHPVALLPGRLGHHVLVDPANGKRVRLNSRIATALAPTAHAFYRPLPERPLSSREVLFEAVRRGRSDVVALLAAGVASGVIALVMPVATVTMFDNVVPAGERGALVGFALTLIAAALALALLQVARGLATQRLQTRVGVAVQGGLWDRLLRLPPQFFRAYTVGELANRSLGIETMRQLLAPATVDVFITAGFSVASFALLLAYAPGLAAVAGGVIVLMLGVMAWGSHKQLRAQRSAWASEMRVAGFVAQLLTAVGKLRVAGAEDRAFGRWAQEFAKQRRSAQRAMRAINAVATFTVAAPLVCELAVFAASSSSAGKGLTVATFVGFNAALLQVLIALVALGPAVAAVVAAVPLVETTQPILQAVPEITSDGDDPGELSGEIELCNVSFRYGPYGPLAVDDVSFRIRAGELVAIVGPSGSGKSTLIRLLLGFEEPQSGSVLFDGQDLDELDIERVRQQLGVVLQDGALLPTDVLTNLVGVSGASLEDAWRALRMVGLAEQIEQLPMGIHTMISEQSSTFSGGERQRLMLARALVRRPRIMLLDEATSAVDAKAEAQIAASLSSVPATRVVVAHRLTTIAGADRIYVMLGGRLVARGNYDELLESSSTFAELVNRQRL
jgi:ATP-binding cassette subfamily C protein